MVKVKRTILFHVLIITLTMAVTGNAKTLKYIELGINRSRFIIKNCKSQIGFSSGIGLEYYPLKSFNGFLDIGLAFQQKKFILKNISRPSNIDINDSDVIIENLDINISYIELPFIIGFSQRIIDKNLILKLFTGYIVSIPIRSRGQDEIKDIIFLALNEKGKYDFDYSLVDENYTSLSKNLQFGLRLSFQRFALIVSFTKALSITKGVSSLSVQDKINTFKISTAYIF
jgi:hypothetical protein